MRRSSTSAAVLLLLIALLGAGCRRRAATTPAPARLSEDHCWWAVLRSTLPPDSVAARFERAFTTVGLTGATRTRSADTAWVHAGPTPLGGRQHESRAVAYWHGDSTHFRYYVAIAPASQGRAQPADTLEREPGHIGFCGEIARAAAIQTSAPRSPTGEESLTVWTRIP
ncbi:MAG: hypothetical protein WKG32_04040 [Gemmatimonadaceae bacterium]